MNPIAMESLSTTLSGSVTRMCELQAVGICVWPGFVAAAQSKEVKPSTSEVPIEKCKHVLLLPCDLSVY
jgi:hypothetical protein